MLKVREAGGDRSDCDNDLAPQVGLDAPAAPMDENSELPVELIEPDHVIKAHAEPDLTLDLACETVGGVGT